MLVKRIRKGTAAFLEALREPLLFCWGGWTASSEALLEGVVFLYQEVGSGAYALDGACGRGSYGGLASGYGGYELLVGRGTGEGYSGLEGFHGSGAVLEVLEGHSLVEVAVHQGLGDYLVHGRGRYLGYGTCGLLE